MCPSLRVTNGRRRAQALGKDGIPSFFALLRCLCQPAPSAVNLVAAPYFAWIVAASGGAQAAVLLACAWILRRQPSARWMVWWAAGGALTGLAWGLPGGMEAASLGGWSMAAAWLQLCGAWCWAQGMALRYGRGPTGMRQRAWMVAGAAVCLYCFARAQGDLRAQGLWLSLGVGLVLLAAAGSLRRAAAACQWADRLLCGSYAVLATAHLLGPAAAWWWMPTEEAAAAAMRLGTALPTLCLSLVLGGMAWRTSASAWRAARSSRPRAAVLQRRGFMEAAEALLNDPRSGPWTMAVMETGLLPPGHGNAEPADHALLVQQIHQVLLQHVRPGDLAARFGQEEWVLLWRRTSPAEAEKRMGRLREHLKALSARPQGQTVTASFGLAAVEGPLHWTVALSRADAQRCVDPQMGPVAERASPTSTTGRDAVSAADGAPCPGPGSTSAGNGGA